MLKIITIALISAVLVCSANGLSFAMCGVCEGEHSAKTTTAEKGAINAGNKICPVTDSPIDEKTKATYEYKGKTYNFCCPMCIDEFKKDPEKYIEKIEREKGTQSSTSAEHQHSH